MSTDPKFDYQDKFLVHFNAFRTEADVFREKDYNNDLYDSWVTNMDWTWVIRHRKVFQSALVDYYIGMSKIDESEQEQPMFNNLMQSIDRFVGFLNQEPPKE